MIRRENSRENRIARAAWLALIVVLVVAAVPRPVNLEAGLLSVHAQQGDQPVTIQPHRIYLPVIRLPQRIYLPLVGRPGSVGSGGMETLLLPAGQRLLGAPAPRGFVTRDGENLQLSGQPFTFIGTNVSYLAGPYFPEDRMEEVISVLAAGGVEVIRVWVEPRFDLDRVERMLDLGRQYNIRFILTLQDFFGQQDGWWFKAKYKTVDMPHIRQIVPRFAQRPEVLMWELMNEPTCPAEDADRACWEALYRWAEVTSQVVKGLDPHHLISVGTQRAGFDERAIDAFRNIHALDTIDIVSVHGQGGRVAKGGRQLERDIAHELGKPIFFGEIHLRGHDKQCQPLSSEALHTRAQTIAADIEQSWAAGIDGYLLWQYAFGRLGSDDEPGQYYCGVFDYFSNDPVWKVLKDIK